MLWLEGLLGFFAALGLSFGDASGSGPGLNPDGGQTPSGPGLNPDG